MLGVVLGGWCCDGGLSPDRVAAGIPYPVEVRPVDDSGEGRAAQQHKPDLETCQQSRCAAPIVDHLLRNWTTSTSRPSGGGAVLLGCYYSLVSRGAALHADRPCDSVAELLRGVDHRSPAARLDCLEVAAVDFLVLVVSPRQSYSAPTPLLRRLTLFLGRRRPWIEANSVEEYVTRNRRRIVVGVDWRHSHRSQSSLH